MYGGWRRPCAFGAAGHRLREGCTTQLPLGARVEVTATAQAGSTRKPWAGCPTPREGLCQLTLTEDTALEVRFDLDVGPPIEYVRMQIDRQGGGRVTAELPPPFDCGSFCRADVPKRQQLTLTAVPDRGSYFAGWGGACRGAERTCEIWVTDSPQDSLQVIALFSPQVCAHPNFCWDNPIPTAMPVNSVVRFADDDILTMTGDQAARSCAGTASAGWRRTTSGLPGRSAASLTNSGRPRAAISGPGTSSITSGTSMARRSASRRRPFRG